MGNNGRFFGFNRHEWRVLSMVVAVNFCAGLAYSLLPPLYPREAGRKGVPASEFGFVFGIYELSNFLVAPIFGSHMSRLGAKRTFHIGMIVSAGMTIVFSLLADIDNPVTFIVMSIVLRIPQAIGATAVITSSFTIVAVEFPEAKSLAFAIVETIFGFGLCVGPPMATELFEIGGFSLAFKTLGGVYLVSALISIYVFWNDNFEKASTEEDSKNGKRGLLSLLRIPSVALPLFAAFVFEICTGVLPVLMEPHLRMFDLSPVCIGLVFLTYAAVYSITAPIWGTLCDRLTQPMYVSLIGSILLFTGFVFFGPAPFLPVKPTLWMTVLGLILISFGYGANNVSSYTITMRQARINGFPDSMATYSLVSGAWTSSVAFGSCVGPSLAGILYDAVGLRYQTLFNLIIIAILMVALLGFLAPKWKRHSNSLAETVEEVIPILRRSSVQDSYIKDLH